MAKPEGPAESMSENPRKNADPITGEPGAHPVGTGVGAAGGAVAGAAVGAEIGGPIGAAVGTVVGGVAAAYGAHGVAEAMNPKTEEEKYWREHHAKQPYAEKERPYEDYAVAYRTGYEGFHKYPGRPTKRSKPTLRSITSGTSRVPHCLGTMPATRCMQPGPS